jgi:Fatty acid desaturase
MSSTFFVNIYAVISMIMVLSHQMHASTFIIALLVCTRTPTLAFTSHVPVSSIVPSQIRSYTTTRIISARYAVAIPRNNEIDTTISVSNENIQSNISPTDQWVIDLDYENFGREVTALGKELQSMGGVEDVRHLQKMVLWRNLCAIIGLVSVWMTPNPVTVIALSTWTYASWTMIAHHTCHGGYNRHSDENGNNIFNSRGFALGSIVQRCHDWLDWMFPEAWNVEHNRLHHYRLNEEYDPDLVQRNFESIRESSTSMIQKYATIAILFPIWKWFYYAPNTFKELQINKWKQEGKDLPTTFVPTDSITVLSLLSRDEKYSALREVVKPIEFFTQVLGPFLLTRFILIPLPFLFIPGIGPTLCMNALGNVILAELLTNIHAYITIVTNHAGNDLYTFDDAVKPRSPSFYVRQIVGSANYVTNNDDLTDFCHGFLNYQIEHRTSQCIYILKHFFL